MEEATPQAEPARLAAGRDPRHLAEMDRTRPAEAKAPPPGEWAVFHERPFPKRLDPFFAIIAAIVAFSIAAAGIVGALVAPLGSGANPGAATVAGGFVFAVLAYGGVRGVGMAIGAAYRFTRPKSYLVDWNEPVTSAQHNRAVAAFFGVFAMLMAAFWTLHHYG